MKRTLHILRCLVIALWPVVFVFGSGYLGNYIRTLIGLTYNFYYNYWLWLAYGLSGLIFAGLGVPPKGPIGKGMLIAYLTAAVLSVSAALGLLLFWCGIVPLPFPFSFIYLANSTLLLFVAGFTLCAAIRAILLYRKQDKPPIDFNPQ